MNRKRWERLMESFAIASNDGTFERLAAAYAEPHRHYHTAAHITACLAELDVARRLAQFPHEVEMALWFHDAVYQPGSGENERRSAQWAERFLEAAGVAEASRRRVYAHVLATQHEGASNEPDSALVLDIDLSILGKPPEIYARYEREVREEYRAVPLALYRRRRRERLQSFLDRPNIYCLPHFSERYEATARANLHAAIAALA